MATRIRTKFRSWLNQRGACRLGKEFAGARSAFDTVTDPALSIDHMVWYLQNLHIPLEHTKLCGFSGRVKFRDLTLHARWRRVTLLLRQQPHMASNSSRVVFKLWHPMMDTGTVALDKKAYVPVPRSTLSGRGEYVYVLEPTGRFQQKWMKAK